MKVKQCKIYTILHCFLNALKKVFSHTSGKKHKFCEKIFKIYQKKGNIYSEGRKNK